jgi:hypothetical protein
MGMNGSFPIVIGDNKGIGTIDTGNLYIIFNIIKPELDPTVHHYTLPLFHYSD